MTQKFITDVRVARRMKNYTQDYVASYLGITREAYNNFERGKNNFRSKDRLEKLCQLLEIKLPAKDVKNETIIEREEVYGQLHEMLEWLDIDRMRKMIENTDFKGVSLNEAIAVGRIMNALDALYDGLSMLDRVATD